MLVCINDEGFTTFEPLRFHTTFDKVTVVSKCSNRTLYTLDKFLSSQVPTHVIGTCMGLIRRTVF